MLRRALAVFTIGAIGLLGWGASGAGALRADPVVVELYTSQGCSSCPPADAYLAELAKRDDVIALALHVDYWDYIGWKDTFAQPGFTRRQKDYARAAGARSVYTPQMVVGGTDHVVGNHPRDVGALIRTHKARPEEASLELTRSDTGRLSIRMGAVGALPNGAVVQVVRFTPEAAVRIRRGENAGREITYHNIVTGWEVIGQWTGKGPLQMEVTSKGGKAPLAVIVQERHPKGGPGRILAAARLQ